MEQIRNVIRKAGLREGVRDGASARRGRPCKAAAIHLQYALFRIDTPKGPKFVDQDGRNYGSFKAWQRENRLPPGEMTYPVNGQLSMTAAGRVTIETTNTPLTVDSTWEKVRAQTDKVSTFMAFGAATVGVASLVLGDKGPLGAVLKLGEAAVAADRTAVTAEEGAQATAGAGAVTRAVDRAGTFVLGPRNAVGVRVGGTVPMKLAFGAGIPAGAWFTYRSLADINDRRTHGQRLDPSLEGPQPPDRHT